MGSEWEPDLPQAAGSVVIPGQGCRSWGSKPRDHKAHLDLWTHLRQVEGSRDRGAPVEQRDRGGVGEGRGVTVKGSKVSGHTVGNQPNQEHPGVDPGWSVGSLIACQGGFSIPSPRQVQHGVGFQ